MSGIALKATNNKTIARLFIITLLVKVGLGVTAVLFVNLGLYHPMNDHLLFQNLSWPHFLHTYFMADSGWYQFIVENGYRDTLADYATIGWTKPNLHFAFFPLYPMSIKGIVMLTGWSFDTSAFLFNIGILYFLVRVFYLFLLQFGLDEKKSFRTVLIFLLFPFSLHIYFNYTEALYFTLLMASFLFIARKQWWQLVVVSSLLVLTRPNGLLVFIPLALFMHERNGTFTWASMIRTFKSPAYYVLLAMPITFFAWCLFQQYVTGDFFAFSTAQSGWNKHFMFPLLALFRNGFWQEQFDSVYCIVTILLAIYWFRKWSPSFNALVWIGIALPLSAGSVISMTRYISVLFPFHLQAGLSKFTEKYFRIILIVFILLQLVCMKYWVEENSLMY